MENLIINNTPWEEHEGIFVKREDLSCPPPGPSFSKIRGLSKFLFELKNYFIPIEYVGVLDTIHSKAGWGVAYLCKFFDLKCINFYPLLKSDVDLRKYQKISMNFGARLYPLKAGMSAVLFNQAKKILFEKFPKSYMLPNGLKLVQSVEETKNELVISIENKYLERDWVVSVSSGTIAAGVIKGLCELKFKNILYLHLGYSRSISGLWLYLKKMLGNLSIDFDIKIIDENYEYKDFVEFDCSFPCNSYYDLKAWKWIKNNLILFNKGLCFWNIGA